MSEPKPNWKDCRIGIAHMMSYNGLTFHLYRYFEACLAEIDRLEAAYTGMTAFRDDVSQTAKTLLEENKRLNKDLDYVESMWRDYEKYHRDVIADVEIRTKEIDQLRRNLTISYKAREELEAENAELLASQDHRGPWQRVWHWILTGEG